MEELRMETKKGIVRDFLENVAGSGLLEWLESSGYYEAPAAVKHHGNRTGGLFDHSLQVTYELIRLTNNMGLKWERKESPAVIGLLHDVCKLDDYIMVDGDEIIGQQEDGSPERRKKAEMNPEPEWSGHGKKSLIMLNGMIDLTEEEKLCIGYHMGAFSGQEEWNYYTRAVKRCQNVLYTHMADMIASQIKGV